MEDTSEKLVYAEWILICPKIDSSYYNEDYDIEDQDKIRDIFDDFQVIARDYTSPRNEGPLGPEIFIAPTESENFVLFGKHLFLRITYEKWVEYEDCSNIEINSEVYFDNYPKYLLKSYVHNGESRFIGLTLCNESGLIKSQLLSIRETCKPDNFSDKESIEIDCDIIKLKNFGKYPNMCCFRHERHGMLVYVCEYENPKKRVY